MRKGDTYTLLFALAICAVCSIVLAVAVSSLRERQQLNIELDRKMNVLKAFGVKAGQGEVQELFERHISEIDCSAELEGVEEAMPLYLWSEDGQVTMYAFPVSGKGLWSTIKGYISLKSDLDTIQGITFYDHGETPGLGGEVEQDWFQEQFQGKRIMSDGGDLARFLVLKGKVADRYPDGNPHAVDGISGATMTGKGVQNFLNEEFERYNRYFAGLREGE
jgi:Na+-transporting NADH:ubiquinone oxidoreductase subunit C